MRNLQFMQKDYHFKPLSGDESRTEELYFAD